MASEIVRVTDDAQVRLSMLKRFIELAHCCHRDVQNLHAHVRRIRRPQPVGRAATQGPLGEAADQVGEAQRPSSTSSAIPKSNSAAMRALLRCEHEVGVAGV